MTTQRARAIEILSWCMFDFANSSYTTVILTVSFGVILINLLVGADPWEKIPQIIWSKPAGQSDPELELVVRAADAQQARAVARAYLEQHWQTGLDPLRQYLKPALESGRVLANHAEPDGRQLVTLRFRLPQKESGAPAPFDLLVNPPRARGNRIWAWTLAASNLLIVVLAPVLGALADYCAAKKKFLFASYVICVAFTALLYFATAGYVYLAVIFVLLATAGFSAGENFIASFLPGLGPREELGRLSGYAWALGYFGGLFSIVCVQWATGLDYYPENFERLRWTGPVTAAFFLVAGIPTFVWLREPARRSALPAGEHYWTIGLKRVGETLRHLRMFRDLAVFLAAFFFIMAALSVVVSFAAVYGVQELGMVGAWQLWFFVLLQLTAAAGAFLFGFLQDRIGAKKAINMTLVIWVATILGIYGIKEITMFVNAVVPWNWEARVYFMIVGNFAGFCLGATQSASRALVGKFSPLSRSGEFFGFWGLAGKLAAAFGLLVFGLQDLARLRQSVLLCAVFFLVALGVMAFVNERRGTEVAQGYVEREP